MLAFVMNGDAGAVRAHYEGLKEVKGKWEVAGTHGVCNCVLKRLLKRLKRQKKEVGIPLRKNGNGEVALGFVM